MVKTHYVDSNELEQHWFDWLIARAVPSLEPYRRSGLLYTKIIGRVKDDDGSDLTKNGKTFPDPMHPVREHCLYVGTKKPPILFTSTGGIAEPPVIQTLGGAKNAMPLERPFKEQMIIYGIPKTGGSDQKGYCQERPAEECWKEMLHQISKICHGISMKFTLRSEEDRSDLASEALLQVIGKLERDKLVYIPGKAPVFNLLTTTIFRCMFSILNRDNKRSKNANKLVEGLTSGAIPGDMRSFGIISDSGGNQAGISIKTH